MRRALSFWAGRPPATCAIAVTLLLAACSDPATGAPTPEPAAAATGVATETAPVTETAPTLHRAPDPALADEIVDLAGGCLHGHLPRGRVISAPDPFGRPSSGTGVLRLAPLSIDVWGGLVIRTALDAEPGPGGEPIADVDPSLQVFAHVPDSLGERYVLAATRSPRSAARRADTTCARVTPRDEAAHSATRASASGS